MVFDKNNLRLGTGDNFAVMQMPSGELNLLYMSKDNRLVAMSFLEKAGTFDLVSTKILKQARCGTLTKDKTVLALVEPTIIEEIVL